MIEQIIIKRKKIITVVGLLIISGFLSGCANNSNRTNSKENGSLMSKAGGADKIEVVHFHATQQCWSCLTVGEYALKTIKEKFSDEYKKGTIVYKDINGELPANQEIVIKYQASSSSLFINAIKDGKDNIEEDVNVWRYVTNETTFISYFENKLKSLLE